MILIDLKRHSIQCKAKSSLILRFFINLFTVGTCLAQPLLQAQDVHVVTVDSIFITGNSITKPQIILRELMIREGITYSPAELDTLMRLSRDNIFNTQLFNFVSLTLEDTSYCDSCKLLHINVLERWYIWPVPIFKLSDRNFNVWWETRDPSRISYGGYVDWRNFRGRNEKLKLTLQFGYEQNYSIEYQLPYINKKKTLGLGFLAGYSRYHEVNYKTEENKQQFLDASPDYARQIAFGAIQLHFRPNIFNTHLFEVRYDLNTFADTLANANPYYSDGLTEDGFPTIHYKFKSDHRDYQSYPLTGYYVDLELNKVGFFNESGPDFLFLTSALRRYWQFGNRFYLAAGINGKLSDSRRQPYFLVRGLGYDRDFVRGYEYYVIDGQNFGLLKSSFKFSLIPRQETRIRFLSNDKFARIYYQLLLTAFADLGYVDNNQYYGTFNSMENELLIGYGIGLDFITYYDVVIRLEYSLNRMGETGFYLHFRASI